MNATFTTLFSAVSYDFTHQWEIVKFHFIMGDVLDRKELLPST